MIKRINGIKKSDIFCIIYLALVLFAAGAQESRRTALVIGNSAYKSSSLKNPANDAKDMAEALKQLGFNVKLYVNADYKTMYNAIRSFGKELSRGGVGLFYYAGHGVQVDGANYLIPVGADIQEEDEVKFNALDANLVLGKMEKAGNRTNIVILDACRNNPFSRSFRSSSRGLAVIDAPSGSLMVYSTAPGSVAADGSGRNGIFTGALLRHIRESGVDAEIMLREVRRDVMAETNNEQTPWTSSSLTGSFYFKGNGAKGTGVKSSGSGVRARGEITENAVKKETTFIVEKAYGNAKMGVKTSGTFYLNGKKQGNIPAEGEAVLKDLEAGKYRVEMRYDNGKTETKNIIIKKNKTIEVSFTYTERPEIPEDLVLVKAGTFRMGSNNGYKNEKPVHRVTISRGFYIGKYEVTQKRWREIMGNNPSSFKGDNLPVESVSWYDAVEFCNRLSKKEGLTPVYSGSGNNISYDSNADGYRLPTEAEWEYTARGGNRSSGYKYAGSNSVGDVVWYGNNAGETTHPVGTKEPNELGIYDMSGNVWEWCWDRYGDYGSYSQTDPEGSTSGSKRVVRGGGWYAGGVGCRSSDRGYDNPSGRDNGLGFRVARRP